MLAVIGGKTGSLLATAARLGGLTGGLGAEAGEALGQFGMAFGMSLQILDDILDLVSSVERLGKPTLADFANGTITLPAVAALRHHPSCGNSFGPTSVRSITTGPSACCVIRTRWVTRPAARCSTPSRRLRRFSASPTAPATLTGLAGWPLSYLAEQLDTKVEPALRPLLADGYSPSRRIA